MRFAVKFVLKLKEACGQIQPDGAKQPVAAEDMEIADGGTASLEFMRITFGKVTAAERKRVRAALEKYCGLDTEGMVRIVEKL